MTKTALMLPRKTALVLLALSAVIGLARGQSGQQQLPAPSATREAQVEEARRLSAEVEELIERRDYDRAMPKAERALAIREQVLGTGHPEVAFALGNVAHIFYAKKNYVKARELYKRALEIQESSEVESHEAAELLNNYGVLCFTENDRQTAERYYKHALEMEEKIPKGLENPKVANIMTNLALILFERQDYDGARELYRRAQDLLEKTLGKETPKLITTLNFQALIHLQTGRLREATTLFSRAVDLLDKAAEHERTEGLLIISNLLLAYLQGGNLAKAEETAQRTLTLLKSRPGDNLFYQAAACNGLAQFYRAKGDPKKATSFYERAVGLLIKASLDSTAYAAELMTNLGYLYNEQGQYDKSEEMLKRALNARRSAAGETSPGYATSLSLLADVYLKRGNYRDAESTYSQALGIYRKQLGEEHPFTATVINNLGVVALTRGDCAAAEPLLMQVLKIREKVLDAGNEDVAASLMPLARCYRLGGNLDKALGALQRTLKIYERSRGGEDPLVAKTLNEIGLVYIEKDEPRQAEPLLRRALEINEKALGKDHLNLTPIINNLALVQEALGDLNEAQRLDERAVGMYEKSGVKTNPELATILANLSRVSDLKGDIARAVSLADRAAEIEEHYLALMLAEGSENQNFIYWQTLLASTSRKISLHTIDAPNDEAAARLALTTILRRKGRVLDTLTDSVRALRAQPGLAGKALLDEFEAARSRVVARIPRGSDDEGADPAEVARLEAEYQRLEALVIGAGAKPHARPVTLEDVRRLIPPGAALVEFAAYKPFDPKRRPGGRQWGSVRHVAYVLRRQGRVRWVDLGDVGDINCGVWDLRAALRNPSAKPDGKDVTRLAREMDERVMRRVRGLLGNARQVFISPDMLLQLVPFEALRDERGRYLIESYTFTYLGSGRDLLRLQSHTPSGQPPVIVANPNFDQGGRGAKAATPDADSSGPEPAGQRWPTFSPLPGTEEEASELKKLLPGAQTLEGAEATESALKQIRSPRILHIATHGFFAQPVSPNLEVTKVNGVEAFKPCIQLLPLEFTLSRGNVNYLRLLSQSGIALAGANNPGGDEEDGILTAFEFGGLDLRGTKLVVLSACETGLGDAVSGSGMLGLRRSLALAGAESNVLSLWKVNEDATRNLMVWYYRRLMSGEGRGAALRRVKLQMLREKEYSHPYFWAAFVASGDWRGLESKP
jgi:CHAT domain-containing protein/tetratricopeptide (TPR) repeat protein